MNQIEIHVALIISPTEARHIKERCLVLAEVRNDDGAMRHAEQVIESFNSSRKWSIGAGYNWSGREYEKRAIGCRILRR
jgi:hypothetical protein